MTKQSDEPHLKRVIGFPLLVLYALGVTIGAGIYVLIGTTAARAGIYAPVAFLLAAFVMAFNAGSFAEFSTRIPQSAGEAAYVHAGFGQSWLTLVVGSSIILSATIAAAAISLGSAGYVGALIDLPQPVIVVAIISLMGLLAAWGVAESVMFAGILTVIELLGLLVIVYAGYQHDPEIFSAIPEVFPALDDRAALAGIFGASLIAFFAFIGFDDVVNLVEETRNPAKVMPWAIIISLIIVTIVYFFVVLVAVKTVDTQELASSKAPIGLLFERLTGLSPVSVTLIGVVATLNGVVIQIIVAARVIYGLKRKVNLPKILTKVNKTTKTPLNATILVTFSIIVLALFIPLEALAELTSQIILSVFTLVNISLAVVKWRGDPAPENVFTVPLFIPIVGAICCMALLFGSLILL
jgi:APA family basic amino acid/polyamine antiporter